MQEKAPGRFTVLDSFRGIAALFVAVFHSPFESHLSHLDFVNHAWLFVDFFFVLSGFVIAANYQEKLQDGFGIGKFICLRLGRLYPLYFFMLLLFVVLEAIKIPIGLCPHDQNCFTNHRSPITVIFSALMVQSLHSSLVTTWNDPSWSISAEFYTYVVFAFVVQLFRRRVTIVFAGMALASLVTLYFRSKTGLFAVGGTLAFIRCLYGFSLGVLAWQFYSSNSVTLPIAGMTEGLVAGAAILLISRVSSAISILIPLYFLVLVIVFSRQAGSVSRALEHRLLKRLGEISYSIYMVHYFFREIVFMSNDGQIASANQAWGGDLKLLAYLATVLVFSNLTYEFIERPSREAVRAIVKRHKLDSAAADEL